MTTRDRLMLMGIVVLLVLVGVWFTTVAPERERASKVTAEVEAARQKLGAAESQADSAVNAQAQYSSAYASLVSLGQAVPASAETPALIYTLDKATHSRDVQFSSISTGAGGSSSSAGATPSALSAGFSQQPFTFIFKGSFVELYKLFRQLEGYTAQTPAGQLRVNGRLLTIDSVSLSPEAGEVQSSAHSSKQKAGQLTGTVTATAYVLPAGQSALGGATPSGPAGASTAASTTTSSGTPGAAPAVIKATP